MTHRMMLFAWPFIMHDMIHNLLHFFYHLQRMNNVIVASCFQFCEDSALCVCSEELFQAAFEQYLNVCVFNVDFKLSGNVLNICNEVKYLGHVITDQVTDDEDIYRQCRMFYVRANIL